MKSEHEYWIDTSFTDVGLFPSVSVKSSDICLKQSASPWIRRLAIFLFFSALLILFVPVLDIPLRIGLFFFFVFGSVGTLGGDCVARKFITECEINKDTSKVFIRTPCDAITFDLSDLIGFRIASQRGNSQLVVLYQNHETNEVEAVGKTVLYASSDRRFVRKLSNIYSQFTRREVNSGEVDKR